MGDAQRAAVEWSGEHTSGAVMGSAVAWVTRSERRLSGGMEKYKWGGDLLLQGRGHFGQTAGDMASADRGVVFVATFVANPCEPLLTRGDLCN